MSESVNNGFGMRESHPEGLRIPLAYDRKSASEQMKEDEAAEKMGGRIRT
jgi:hypothetical protein